VSMSDGKGTAKAICDEEFILLDGNHKHASCIDNKSCDIFGARC
jgi:hypothetical protein